ncbi:MAG: hypothetical protein IJ715_05405 [Bacilli bacterium]|nr:hypothetical protein [Bacilli bacterium]MBR1937103.1 hypothetical protein [Bacilli bacterium]
MKDNNYYSRDDQYEVSESTYDAFSLLASVSTWVIRIILVIAAILFLYFIFMGNIVTALLYALGLILAYFFGYFFVYLLDFITSNN